MRRSHKTNTLVLVSDHTKALYEDRWDGNVLHYTGMGRVGDQTLTSQNKTVAESISNKVELHLFEVFEAKKYLYMGVVKLAGESYQEEQLDDKGQHRQVWVFPLMLEDKQKEVFLSDQTIKMKQELREKKVRKLDESELENRARTARRKSSKRQTISTTYERDPYITEFAKRWAKGICQLCDQPAPYVNKNGEPHLHTHHIKWLSLGGEDSIYNTIALCPNCHDKMHILDLEEDVRKLQEKVTKYVRNRNDTNLN
ncbi:HNH endonuclease [Bacillus altitudinis]|nr:restriction endonuclease [Bacillus altitudinis]KQL48216.1 restriction endonuclease [Bacillus sp. FJAT-21955]MBU8654865.1 HNH endonuclease [Bacillus altitudinis]MBU8780325.1 HNH endonuclease [Bacillus altitudinis]